MGNSRIHYVARGASTVCGIPWKHKRRTRLAERATCDGCREVVAQQAAAGVQRDTEEAYTGAELDAIVLVDALCVAREYAAKRGRWREAVGLGRLEQRARALRQELHEVLAGSAVPVGRGALGAACPVCAHPSHEPGSCSAVSGSLLSLAPRRCPCTAGVGVLHASKPLEVAA